MPKLDVVAVGNVNIDITIKLSRLPRPEEKLLAEGFSMSLGGAATNFSIACAKLGLSPGLIARVGSGLLARMALEALRGAGVDVSHVRPQPGAQTGLALMLDIGGPASFLCFRGANASLSPSDLDEQYISSARLVLGASVSMPVAMALARLCSRLGKPLMLDPGGVLAFHEPPARPSELVGAVSIFTPNKVELLRLTGLKELREAIELAWSWGPKLLVVKAGPEGCFVFDGSSLEHLPALEPRKFVSSAGAGDAFNAAFALGMLIGLSTLDSARLGIAFATLKLEREGASNMPTLEELRAFLAKLGWLELLGKLNKHLGHKA